MASTVIYKCPSCGGSLEFSPDGQAFRCPFCTSVFSEAELLAFSEKKDQEKTTGIHGYHCQNCGAEIVTEETTAATRCCFCHSPVVLTDRLQDEFRPDAVLPFRFNREEALERFHAYIRKKKFIDPGFFDVAQLENFSGVYEPCWYADLEGNGAFSGEGHTTSSVTRGSTVITTTRYYRLEREGRLSFRHLFRKALKKEDRQLTDGIHPFDWTDMKPFASGYLSGFLAEKRDVEQEDAISEMRMEAEGYAEELLTRHTDLKGLKGNTVFELTDTKANYVLLPVWVLTWERNGKQYDYRMNGQTGAVCGKLPLNRLKLGLTALLAGLAACGLLCLGGMLLW